MRVLITRPHEQAGEFAESLRTIGAEPVFLPTIKISPIADTTILDRCLSRLHCYDWLILTSANAVEVVFERLAVLGINSPPENLRIAVVGPKTATKLIAEGFPPQFVPGDYIAEAILPGLGDLRGMWVLYPTADLADDTLPVAIHAAGGIAHVVTAYHTIPAQPELEGLLALQAGVDMITFTSGSTARNFFTIAQKVGLDPLALPGDPQIACIGPKTAKAAREIGFRIDIVAETHTAAGLVEAIKNQVNRTTHP